MKTFHHSSPEAMLHSEDLEGAGSIPRGWTTEEEAERACLPEPILEPERAIVDAHHHLWYQPIVLGTQERSDGSLGDVVRGNARYLFDEFLSDVKTGHNVRATVFVETHAMYRVRGPEAQKSIGEVEFANGVAAMAASGLFGQTAVCAGIVGNADLRLGESVDGILLAHINAGGGRYRGVRNATASAPNSSGTLRIFSQCPPGILLDERFRQGFRRLQKYGLSYDAIALDIQLKEVLDLARAFPETPIVLNHLGMPVNESRQASGSGERFDAWRDNIRELSRCANLVVKLGGLGMPFAGSRFFMIQPPATSAQLADEWRPYIETCIEAFGADRCMFESNFPMDSGTCSYPVLWNAFKRLTSDATEAEKDALFRGTATRVYGLQV